MTTGGCCHLPGSLCDCASGPGEWKSAEEAGGGGGGGCPALYVAQVTAVDGRLLSSVLKPSASAHRYDASGTKTAVSNGTFTNLFDSRLSDGPICRICHEGGSAEGLLSPCRCAGSLGKVHRSCLETWLSASNTSYCELCHAQFSIERRARQITEVRGQRPGGGT